MTEPAIHLENVRKRYAHFTLKPTTLSVPAGSVLGLIGPNGAGKSTLLRIMVGLVRAEGGVVTILNRRMPQDERAIKARTAFVSDDMALYRSETLAWHMRWVSEMSGTWDAGFAARLIAQFDLNPDQRAGGLSRGQQVKALLLLALARQPEILLLDEPTAGLDPVARRDVIRLLSAHRGRTTMVLSSHTSDDISDLAADVAFVHDGAIIARGRVTDFVRAGHNLEQAFLSRVDAIAVRGAA